MHCRVQWDREAGNTGAEMGTVGDTLQPITLCVVGFSS